MINIKDLGGRKFILSVVILLFSFLLIIINKLSADEYLKLTFAIIGIYSGLNLFQKKLKIE